MNVFEKIAYGLCIILFSIAVVGFVKAVNDSERINKAEIAIEIEKAELKLEKQRINNKVVETENFIIRDGIFSRKTQTQSDF